MKERKTGSGQGRLRTGRVGAIYSDESNGGFSRAEALKCLSSAHLFVTDPPRYSSSQMTVKVATDLFIHLF